MGGPLLCLVALLSAPCCKPSNAPRQEVDQRSEDLSNEPAPRPTAGAAAGLLPAREEGPPLHEEPRQVQAAGAEAEALTRSLLAGGISPREVASIADMRGYRHYRKRRYGQAHAWFFRATETDRTFELSLFNAARCAALLGRGPEALVFLRRLRGLQTPLGRALLRRAERDPDLATARPRQLH